MGVESTVLGALAASALTAIVVLVGLRGPAAPPTVRQVRHRGRLRLPARTFERAVVVAVVAAACAVAEALARRDGHVVTGGVVVAGAVLWCARRGVFLSPRSDDEARNEPGAR
jgi:hypothetical protein